VGLQKHYFRFRELGAELYAISVDSPAKSKAFFVDGEGVQFPILSDQSRETIRTYGVLSIANIARPSAFVIDTSGIIRYKSIGDTTNRESIDTLIEELEKLSVSDVFNLSVPSGTSLVHLPFVVTGVNGESRTITKVSDLFEVLGGETNVDWLITTPTPTRGGSTQFQVFFQPSDADFPANAAIQPDTGIIASLRNAVELDLTGDPVEGELRLYPGPNLIGIPHMEAGIRRVSDFAQFPGIVNNISLIAIYINGTFQPILPNDIVPGAFNDHEISSGQAFVVVAKESVVINFGSE
jgi:hypothetical protein